MRVQTQDIYTSRGEIDGVQTAGEIEHVPGLFRYLEQMRVKRVHGRKRQALARGGMQRENAGKRLIAALGPLRQQLFRAPGFFAAEERPGHAMQFPARGAISVLGFGVARRRFGIGAFHQRPAQVIMLLHRAKAPSAVRKSAGCAPSSNAGRRGHPSSAGG